jgi:hypothetical protein
MMITEIIAALLESHQTSEMWTFSAKASGTCSYHCGQERTNNYRYVLLAVVTGCVR